MRKVTIFLHEIASIFSSEEAEDLDGIPEVQELYSVYNIKFLFHESKAQDISLLNNIDHSNNSLLH